MKRSHQIAAGIAASLGLFLATAAFAQQGGYGRGPCATNGAQPAAGYRMGPGAGMGPAWTGRGSGYGPGAAVGPGFGRGFASQLMTPEEWAAHREKMLNAATFDERRQIAAVNHAEMQKRAAERGISLPQQPGPRNGMGPRFRAAPQAPTATE